MTDRLTDANYVHDALRERLLPGWSLNRAQQDGHTYYRWTDWTTARQCVVEVDEDYAHKLGTVDELCTQLTDAVLDSFNTTVKNLDPISPQRLVSGRA